HAAFMPDADWAVSRHRPTLSRSVQSPRFRHRFKLFTTRHQRFTRVRLFESHLPGLSPTFPATLTTRALYPRSLWWFETCSCKPASRGRPSSSVKHRKHRSADARVLGTHCTARTITPNKTPRHVPASGNQGFGQTGTGFPPV